MKQQRLIVVFGIFAVAGLLLIVLLPGSNNNRKTSPQRPVYVAMGDSVAAGVGLETASDSSACGRTNESYPSLAATSLNMQLKSYACSGATLAAGILGNQTVNNLSVAPQLDQVLKESTPRLVTLTIGANDIGWTDILTRCITSACGSDNDTSEVDTKLQTVKTGIQEIVKRIQSQFKNNTPTFMVMGYYHVFPESADCTTLAGIEPQEQRWWSAQEDKLDLTMADASSGYGFVNFAPVNFSGHDICSVSPWIQDLQGRIPFHPNDEGQKVIADTIAKTYEALKK